MNINLEAMLQPEVRIGNRRVDLVIEEPGIPRIFVEVKKGTRGHRDLRDEVLTLAILLNENPDDEGRLVLVDPKTKDDRIRTIWNEALLTIKDVIADRLSLAVFHNGQATLGRGLPANDKIVEALEDHPVGDISIGARMPRAKYLFVIQKILISRWMLGMDYISAKDLAVTGGTTYPTVKKAVERLQPYIERGPKNAIKLGRFPKEPFSEMVARGDRVRVTRYYADTSGRPRSPNRLVDRLSEIESEDVSVGGVIGARMWWPRLDIVGTPRLDLSVLAPANYMTTDFIEYLDPALKEVNQKDRDSTVVVHAVRRVQSLFERSRSEMPLADPAECLLDLFEMGYTSQASEWLESIKLTR